MSHEFHVVAPPKKIVAITAPSGAGKSTIVKKLIEQLSIMEFSVSCTTRQKRESESKDLDYYFISVPDFQLLVQKGEFIEHEEVYPGQFYGSLKSEVDRIWRKRKIVLYDMDVKGALNIKKMYGNDALTIFIAPPDKATLVRRLTNRNTEDKESLKKRIKKSEEEMSYQDKFDKVVVNSDFDIAFMNVKNVITNFLNQGQVAYH